jgi:hypothetical protein
VVMSADVRSLMGISHMAFVVLTATRAFLRVHVVMTQPWMAAFRGAEPHIHGTSVGVHSVWFCSADSKQVA